MSTTRPISSPATTQSTGDRRSAEAELRTLITRFAPGSARLIAALRRSLRKRLPTAHELVYEYRDWFVISYSPSEHGYQGVLAVRASADGVRLYFNCGKKLHDPDKLLSGTSQTRWLSIEKTSTLARPSVTALIDEAIARSTVPFASDGPGPVVVRSTSANKRRRPAQRTPARSSAAAARAKAARVIGKAGSNRQTAKLRKKPE